MAIFRRFPGASSRIFLGTLLAGLAVPALAGTESPWACQTSEKDGLWRCKAHDNSAGLQRPQGPLLNFQTLPAGLSSGGASSPTDIPHNLDWIPAEQLSEEQRSQLKDQCRGAYVDPLAGADTTKSLDEFAIEASAGSSEIAGDVARFDGVVRISQGYRQLSSGTAVVDRAQNRAALSHNVVVREPGVLMLSDSAELDTESGEASLENTRYVLHDAHMRGGAGNLTRQENGDMLLRDAYLTYCPPGNNSWRIAADTIELDSEEGLGIARQARVEVGGTPILYTPWLSFPLDDRRASGILWPSVGSDSDGGLDVAIPYYFNLAPHYDATLTPRVISERGVSAELELRHLSEQAGMWAVGAAFLPSDKEYASKNPGANNDRWLSRVEQDGLFSDRWRTHIDYTRVSDDAFFRDLDTTSLDARRSTHLTQLGEADYLGDDWTFGVRAQQFQTIDSKTAFTNRNSYKVLPKIHAAKRRLTTPFEPDILINAEYVNFDHDTLLTGQRVYAEAGVAYPMSWAAGFVTPTVKYRHVDYTLNDPVTEFGDESPSTGAGLFSLDAGLFFERDLVFSGEQFVNTLEPRIFYLYSEEKDQADHPLFDTIEPAFSYARLFRDSRFIGHDRIDDANQVSLGLTSRLVEGSSGREMLTASVGQVFYFEDRLVGLRQTDSDVDVSNSEIAAELRFMPTTEWTLNTAFLWDGRQGQINDANLAINYSPESGGIYNLGYSYRRPGTTTLPLLDPEQLDFSAFWPVSDRWRLFTRLRYSLDRSERIEDSVGFEYNSCCWRVRIMHSRSVDQDDTLFTNNLDDLDADNVTLLEFQLKGLGSIGNRIGHALQELVWGYSEDDY
ncbi:MAG: LPS-assembly protein [Halieaceae bacterium]|jgi:LPS-assembly protein